MGGFRAMARAQLLPEEQLEDLQRRFQLLEGERKATYETAQLNIRQNKEIIRQMKEENKSLRQSIAQLRNEAPKSTEKQVEEKMAEMNLVQKKLDQVKMECTKKKGFLEELDDKCRELS